MVLENIAEIEDIENLMDILAEGIIKHDTPELPEENNNFLLHMKTRYCRYQVEHKSLTGYYYLVHKFNTNI